MWCECYMFWRILIVDRVGIEWLIQVFGSESPAEAWFDTGFVFCKFARVQCWFALKVLGIRVWITLSINKAVKMKVHKFVIFGLWTFWSKETPLPGGFSYVLCSLNKSCVQEISRWDATVVPWSRVVCKRSHDEIRPSHLVVKSLTHGSWSGNIVNWKHPWGGGLSFDQVWLCFPIIKKCATE